MAQAIPTFDIVITLGSTAFTLFLFLVGVFKLHSFLCCLFLSLVDKYGYLGEEVLWDSPIVFAFAIAEVEGRSLVKVVSGSYFQ